MAEQKTFDNKKFASDLFFYRNNELWNSRREFSEKIGISKHIINHIENEQSTPHINDAYKLCVLMGTNINDYFK